jgi:hypothetical protein
MLQGTLDSFSLVDILRFLERAQKTGGLHVRGDDTGVVYFHQGQITFAAPRPGDTLGEALVRGGLLTDETWRGALDAAGDRPLAEALVWSGALDGDRLRAFLEQHVEEALFDQLRWRDGEFQFRADEEHALGPAFAFPVDVVLGKVQGRLDAWDQISQRIPSLGLVVATAPSLPAGHAEVTLSAEEWRLVVAVDGRRTVEDLARALGQGTFQTCHALYGLLEAGLVGVGDGGPPAADVAPVVNTSASATDRNARLADLASRLERQQPPRPAPAPADEQEGLHRDLVERLITAVKDL